MIDTENNHRGTRILVCLQSLQTANNLPLVLPLYIVGIVICNSYCTHTSKELCSRPRKRSDFQRVVYVMIVFIKTDFQCRRTPITMYISRPAKKNNNNRAEKKLKEKGRHTIVDSIYIKHI